MPGHCVDCMWDTDEIRAHYINLFIAIVCLPMKPVYCMLPVLKLPLYRYSCICQC